VRASISKSAAQSISNSYGLGFLGDVQVLALIGKSLAGRGFSGGENSSVLEGRADHSAQTSAKSDWLAGVYDPRLQRARQTHANS
jgi:hypothetical protein